MPDKFLTVAGEADPATSTSQHKALGVGTAPPANGISVAAGGIDLAAGLAYKINGEQILTETALASSVVGSSLTSVGTLTSLAVSGDLSVDTDVLKVNATTNRVGVGVGSPAHKLDVAGSINVTTGNTLKINSVDVISATALGSSVVGSSLTSVGTLTSLAVTGDLSVDTDVLKVNATSNRVGVGVGSPAHKLDVDGSVNLSTGNTVKINSVDVLSATALGSSVVGSSLTSVGTLNGLSVDGNVNLTTGNKFKINSVDVLSATALGSSVVGSSLTSVGTLTGLTVDGNVNLTTDNKFKINNVDVLSATALGSSVVGSSLTSVGTLSGLSVSGLTTTGTLKVTEGAQVGYVLTSDVDGNATWAAASAGTIGGSIANTQVSIGSGTNTIGGSANLTYSSGMLSSRIDGVTGNNDHLQLSTEGLSDGERHAISWLNDAATGVVARLGAEFDNASSTVDFVLRDLYSAGLQTTETMRVKGNGNVLIGTTTNTNSSKLNVNGSVEMTGFRLTGGTSTNGKVLTADANGVGTWETPSGGGGGGSIGGSIAANQIAFGSGTDTIQGNAALTYDNSTGRAALTKSQSAETSIDVINTNGGTSAVSCLYLGATSGGVYGQLGYFGSGYTTDGAFRARRTILNTPDSGGIALTAGYDNATSGIRFYTGGYADSNLAVTIANTGKLGVGTDTPTAPLHVRKDQNAFTYILVANEGGSTASAAGFVFGSDTSLNYGSLAHYGDSYTSVGANRANSTLLASSDTGGLSLMSYSTNSNAGIRFYTNGDADSNLVAKITNDGKLGVGTDSPTTQVHVNKDQAAADTAIAATNGNASGSARIVVGTDFSNYGDLGYTGSSYATGTQMYKQNGTYLQATGAGGLSVGAVHASGIIRFYSGGYTDTEERARFAVTSGNLLVGTTTDSGQLTVDNGSASEAIFIAKDNTTDVFRIEDGGELVSKSHTAFSGSELKTRTSAVQTTDDTQTTLYSLTLSDTSVYWLEASIIGRKTDGTDRAYYVRQTLVYREGGSATLGTIQTPVTDESDASWDATFTVASNDILVRVTGVAATTINWVCTIRYQRVSAST